jgi:hypothetical protein
MADAATPTATPPPDTRNLTDEVRRALEADASGLPPELLAEQQARHDEYKDYVAVQPIDFGGARAYNEGDAVPNSNVEKYRYHDLGWVAKRTTKEGKKARAEALGIDVKDLEN